MKKILKLIISIVICHSAGAVGSIFTAPAIAGWYAGLIKPVFNPPSWVFGPAWLSLYTLMGVALFLIWQKGLKDKMVKSAFVLFLVHLVFNASWSIVFFGLKSPLFALINIILILAFIVVLIIKFSKISRPAAYLLAPYLLWVSFASILNFFIWWLN